MPSTIISRYTQIDELNIHYLEAGEGEAILLIHGWPTSSYLWRNIISQVSESYRVIALDLPGFGKSDKRLEDSFSFKYYSRAIEGLLKNLEIEQVTLGVHDLGGPVGLYWFVHHMEQVKRLMLFNTLVYPKLSWAVKLFGLATYLPWIKNYLTSQKGLKDAMFFGVHQKKKLNREIITNYLTPFADKNSRKVLLKSVQRLHKKGFYEIEDGLAQFKGPVQIIYGENDRILPDVSDTMHQVKMDLPQARLLSLADCGHFLQEEAPEEISEAIVKFMLES